MYIQNITSLTPLQISALTISQIQSLTAIQIQTLTNSQIQAFTVTQIQVLTSDQFQAFTPAQVANITIDEFSSPSSNLIGKLTPSQIPGLTYGQIAALGFNIRGLNPDQIQALTPTQISQIDLIQLEAIAFSVVASNISIILTNQQYSALTPSQLLFLRDELLRLSNLQALTLDQFSSLEPIQVWACAERGTITSQQMSALTKFQILGIAEQYGFSIFSLKELQWLTATQVAQFTPEEITLLSVAQRLAMGAYSQAQVAALTASQIASLAPADIAFIAPSLIPYFSNTQISALSTTQMQAFTSSQFQQFSLAQTYKFSATQLLAVSENAVQGWSVSHGMPLSVYCTEGMQTFSPGNEPLSLFDPNVGNVSHTIINDVTNRTWALTLNLPLPASDELVRLDTNGHLDFFCIDGSNKWIEYTGLARSAYRGGAYASTDVNLSMNTASGTQVTFDLERLVQTLNTISLNPGLATANSTLWNGTKETGYNLGQVLALAGLPH